jgi:tetratricopeptide (TPR) repeat protein
VQSSLTAGQKGLLRVLLALGGFMAANALYLHFSPPKEQVLPAFYQWMLLGHIYVGLLLLLPMVGFILWHFTVVLRKKHPFAVWSGIGIAAAAVLLAVTGLFLREKANTQENRVWYVVHWVLGLGIPAAYVLHRVSAEQRPTLLRLGVGLGAVAVATLALIGIHVATTPEPPPSPPPFSRTGYGANPPGGDPFQPFDLKTVAAEAQPSSPFWPSPTLTTTGSFVHPAAVTNLELPDPAVVKAEVAKKGFFDSQPIGAAMCARCHPDVVEQWKTSAHRFSSFNNPFYRATVLDMRKEPKGFLKSKWCAGCHDPAVLFPGKMAKEFDVDLPDAQAGITCLTCHSIDRIHSVAGNGGYTFADRTETPYLFSGVKEGPAQGMHDLLVRSKPEVHKRSMKPPILSTSEFCAVCHKVSLQEPVNDYRWFRGQNDYDSWHDSGISRNNPQTFYLPPAARSCQACHMALEPAPLGDVSAKEGMVKSHRFLGINTALPHVRGDADSVKRIEQFLKNKVLRVDVFALKRADGSVARAPDLVPAPVREGEKVELQVVARNLGVGHIFPAGTNDSNEGWMAVEVLGPDGKVLLRSGFLEADGSLSGESHTYGATVVDRDGKRIDRRNAKDIYVMAQGNVIPPGNADVARYALEVPAGLAGKEITVRASLLFRKFKRDYTLFAFKDNAERTPTLPVTEIATATVKLPVLAAGAEAAAGAIEKKEGLDWTRWNDHGIALLRGRDPKSAEESFAEVDRLRPDLPDGPRNLARAKIAQGKYKDALDFLAKAEDRAPDDPRTAFWFGRAHLRLGNYDLARLALDRSLKDFPDDRNTHTDLGLLHYQNGDLKASLAAFLRVLEIDPESADAHYHRSLVYKRLGMEAESQQAAESYRRYKLDDAAPQRTNEFLRTHPDVNREAQSVHVHELRPPK